MRNCMQDCASWASRTPSRSRHGTAEHVERLVRSFRRCKEAEELSREARQQANRYLKYRYTEDDSLVIDAQLPAELGALFIRALDAALPEVLEAESGDFESRDVSAESPVTRNTDRRAASRCLGTHRRKLPETWDRVLERR